MHKIRGQRRRPRGPALGTSCSCWSASPQPGLGGKAGGHSKDTAALIPKGPCAAPGEMPRLVLAQGSLRPPFRPAVGPTVLRPVLGKAGLGAWPDGNPWPHSGVWWASRGLADRLSPPRGFRVTERLGSEAQCALSSSHLPLTLPTSL